MNNIKILDKFLMKGIFDQILMKILKNLYYKYFQLFFISVFDMRMFKI